jgi:hypothetical protein
LLEFQQHAAALCSEETPDEDISDEEIKMIENRWNNSPRKRLVFRTPAEVFHQPLSRVVLRA